MIPMNNNNLDIASVICNWESHCDHYSVLNFEEMAA